MISGVCVWGVAVGVGLCCCTVALYGGGGPVGYGVFRMLEEVTVDAGASLFRYSPSSRLTLLDSRNWIGGKAGLFMCKH